MTTAPDVVPAPHVRRAELQREMLMRERARRSFAGFLKYRFEAEKRRLEWNWHLDYLCELLEAVHRRELTRLLINVPPRTLKSETVAQTLHPWMIGQADDATSSMLSCSVSCSLSARDSRRSRDIVDSDWYANVFPHIRKNRDKWTASEWETMGGAYRLSAGVDGTITGRGADHLVWDDILKPREANSDLVRTNACDWLGETLRSRLNDQKTGTITGIMQRLHELDPTGYLVEQMKTPGADQYEHVCIEMECPKPKVYSTAAWGGSFFRERAAGELLHPNRFGPKEIAALKVALQENYEGQYNQRPVKMEGNFLQWKWFNLLEKLPDVDHKYQVWDYALTERDEDEGCFSVCETWGIDESGCCYLYDVYRARINTVNLVEETIRLARTWKVLRVYGERGQIEMAIRPFFEKRCRELSEYYNLDTVDPGREDKTMRAYAFRALCQAGRVYLPKNAGWLVDWKLEVTAFPRSRFKDQVDAAAHFARKLPEIRAGETLYTPDELEVEMRRKDPNALLAEDVREEVAKAAKPHAGSGRRTHR